MDNEKQPINSTASNGNHFDDILIEKLIETSELNSRIGDLNSSYDEISQKLTYDENKEIAYKGLADIQENSFNKLVELGSKVDYEEIGIKNIALNKALSCICLRLSSLCEQQAKDTEQIRAEQEYLISILPNLQAEIGSTALGLMQKIPNFKKVEQLNIEKEKIESELSTNERMLMIDSHWNLPLAVIDRKMQSQAIEKSGQNGTVFVDEFVVERSKRQSTQESIVERVREKCLNRKNDASEFVAMVLAEQPGYPYTYKELAKYTYPEIEDQDTAESRIRSLIYNLENGVVTIINETLESADLVLQRGRRRKINPETGLGYGYKYVILRAVPIELATNNDQTIIHIDDDGNKTSDIWKAIETTETNEVK